MALPHNRLLYYAIHMYFGVMERLGLRLARKLGLHWVALAHLSHISGSFPK
jgi:hypothetical protein